VREGDRGRKTQKNVREKKGLVTKKKEGAPRKYFIGGKGGGVDVVPKGNGKLGSLCGRYLKDRQAGKGEKVLQEEKRG